ncbi:hypothetical protein PPERSA_08652 [Pseudocohnilembus persalinus]|uniref:TH1 domain-containing protein n=1 Tax=Pseudocohnilembus persalinus TaxID=266149 RepID=A0A0V0QM63_PSEPJ|nr:hypothetical protein PPERSA_08652 [Pseudocohnilembus persalinus]|eukprot:KRX03355.1 hypothetical protein PPERSA_08652 [Pseudocohnilembus persalinus]
MDIQPLDALKKQIINDRDPIRITSNKKIKQSFDKNDEKCLFTCTCLKINDAKKKQERNLIITSKAVYNLKKEDVRKRVPISKLAGMTISKKKLLLIIHVNFESDIYYQIQNYAQIVTIMALILKAYEEFTEGQKLLVKETDEIDLHHLVNYTKEVVNKEYQEGTPMGFQEFGFYLEKIRIERQMKKDSKKEMTKQWEKAYSMTQGDNSNLLTDSNSQSAKKDTEQEVKRYETQDYFRRSSMKLGTQSEMDKEFGQSYIRQTVDSGSSGDGQYQDSQLRDTNSNFDLSQTKSKTNSKSQNMLLQEELMQEQLKETQTEGRKQNSNIEQKLNPEISSFGEGIQQKGSQNDEKLNENTNNNSDNNNQEDNQIQIQKEKELEEAIVKERKEREERERKEREEREKKEAEMRRQREEQEKREYLERKREEQIRKMQEEQAKKELLAKKQAEQKYNDLQKLKLRKQEKDLEKQLKYLEFIVGYHQFQIQLRELENNKLDRRNYELDIEFEQDFDKNYVDAEKDLEVTQNQLRQLRSILKDIEKGHEIKMLPNYERAYQLFQFGDIQNEGKSISELIIELDVKYPPEEYLKKLQEQNQLQKSGEGINSSPVNDSLQSYDKGSLVGLDVLKQQRLSANLNNSEIKSFNVRAQQ